ncbi:MAG TPA: cytochrome c [Longimicrobium sp.]|uniref:c-type cytochrome n=1 Tax=Longimicrobium sp. TaxID=2029185 RepID=UPI002ED802C3
MTSAELRRGARALALLGAAAALPACTDWAGYDIDEASGKVPAFSTMREDVMPDPYEMVREPVPGTVPTRHPLGDVPMRYSQTQLDSIAPLLRNPLTPDARTLARGKLMYEQHCAACHGNLGDGKGPVIGPDKFPYAPALNAAPTQARSDGYIYAVIDAGRGLMPPYGARVTHLDRWAIVEYVRQLQGRLETRNPPPNVSAVGAQVPNAAPVEPAPAASRTPPSVETTPPSTQENP